jgi:hypothetical protein
LDSLDAVAQVLAIVTARLHGDLETATVIAFEGDLSGTRQMLGAAIGVLTDLVPKAAVMLGLTVDEFLAVWGLNIEALRT